MIRPIYETAKDIKAEKEVANLLRETHKLICFKMPISYRIDWAIFSFGKKLQGFMELKIRNVSRSQYPTLMLSLGKCVTGCNLAHLTNTAFWVAVKWTDSFGFCRVTQPLENIGIGGRMDRGDDADIEPVVYLPITEFKDEI